MIDDKENESGTLETSFVSVASRSKTLQFKVFCLEQYKNKHRISGAQAAKAFKTYGVFDYIGAFYDVLHSTGGKYIVEDIDMFIAARQ